MEIQILLTVCQDILNEKLKHLISYPKDALMCARRGREMGNG